MNHLLNVLDGFASILEWKISGRAYVHSRDGFRRDQEKLRRDVKIVGRGLEKVIRVYGEQSRSCTRYEQKR